jgi:hypothetical protein
MAVQVNREPALSGGRILAARSRLSLEFCWIHSEIFSSSKAILFVFPASFFCAWVISRRSLMVPLQAMDLFSEPLQKSATTAAAPPVEVQLPTGLGSWMLGGFTATHPA